MFREKQKIISHSINQSRHVKSVVCLNLKLDDDVGSSVKSATAITFLLDARKELSNLFAFKI